jgi:mannose-6-phosphate isomerase
VKLEAIEHAIETLRRDPRALRLECGVQHYDWGDCEAIPGILRRGNPDRRPFAELWAGAHPDLPSVALVDGVRVPLDQLIRELPEVLLGSRVAAHFGALPFLLKVLAAARPLSLQAHPDSAQARAGFERENREGLALDAPERNYRDPNDKPELLVAISDFYALRGFRTRDEIARVLQATPELAPLAKRFHERGMDIADLFAHILHLDQQGANAVLDPLVRRLEQEDRASPFPRDTIEHWILRAERAFSVPAERDRGLLCMYLLNLVHLHPGQAIYLPAGELHTYLQGVGVELMANSNNVLRGGLTRKHVDVEALLKILHFCGGKSERVSPSPLVGNPALTRYRTTAEELELNRLVLHPGQAWDFSDEGPQILLLTEGEAAFADNHRPVETLQSGEGLLIPPGLRCRLTSAASAVLWVARVPGEPVGVGKGNLPPRE